jgi:hypothetical protein
MLDEILNNCNCREAEELGETLPARMSPDDVCFQYPAFPFHESRGMKPVRVSEIASNQYT